MIIVSVLGVPESVTITDSELRMEMSIASGAVKACVGAGTGQKLLHGLLFGEQTMRSLRAKADDAVFRQGQRDLDSGDPMEFVERSVERSRCDIEAAHRQLRLRGLVFTIAAQLSVPRPPLLSCCPKWRKPPRSPTP